MRILMTGSSGPQDRCNRCSDSRAVARVCGFDLVPGPNTRYVGDITAIRDGGPICWRGRSGCTSPRCVPRTARHIRATRSRTECASDRAVAGRCTRGRGAAVPAGEQHVRLRSRHAYSKDTSRAAGRGNIGPGTGRHLRRNQAHRRSPVPRSCMESFKTTALRFHAVSRAATP